MKNPITKTEFDNWYKETNDPWSYHLRHVQNRIKRSIKFIRKNFIPKQNNFSIVEFGVFNGDVTKYLLNIYPYAVFLCNDISEVAIEYAKNKLGERDSVEFLCENMLNYPFANYPKFANPDLVLLLEVLYYLPTSDRKVFLTNLLNTVNCPIFLSFPIQAREDKENLSESEFNEYKQLFMTNGYQIYDSMILNRNYSGYSTVERITNKVLNYIFPKRQQNLRNQVIYYLRKEK